MQHSPNSVEHDVRVKAFQTALHTPYPHTRSPALALQIAYDQTKLEGESDLAWLERFLRMSGDEYRREIGWDWCENRWSGAPDMAACGELIMYDCLRWYSRGWDMSRHPRDEFSYPEDLEISTIDPRAIDRIARALMPIPGEIIRRTWMHREGTEMARCTFDVWRVDWRHFAWRSTIQSDATHEILGSPVEFWQLEGFIAPALVPSDAQRSFIPAATDGENA